MSTIDLRLHFPNRVADHLLLAPQMIRELIPEANIALFIHAPFPSSEIFRCLPKRKEILDGMLGANLVCFQVRFPFSAPLFPLEAQKLTRFSHS